MRAPWVTSSGSVTVRSLLLLRLQGADRQVGHGEAAPLPGYGGATLDDVTAALEDCRQLLADSDGEPREQLLAECARRAGLPEALAAIDLALWDLAGRRAGAPVWRLLGAREPSSVAVNATIAATDRAGAAAAATAARSAGFSAVKVKVGIGDDGGRLAAVRAAIGPEAKIRIDANGAWSVQEALAALRAFAAIGIELCEEPASGLEAIAQVAARTAVAVALDESARDPAAFGRRACAAVCLKIVRCGGISGLIDAARRARAAGYEVYVASTLDGPLGIAAGLHAAAAVGTDRPCGLATLGVFDGRPDPLPARDGRIAMPSGTGLGEGLSAWYRSA